MGQTGASGAGILSLFTTLCILLSPALAPGQAPPSPEPAPAPAETPATPPAQVQPPTEAPAQAAPVDPFAGSPLLQMFESAPDATAPPLQLRFAPPLELPRAFAVNLFLSAEEEFTDNADQTKDNRRSEFRTRVVPGISIRADRPVGNFNLSYAPEVVFFDNSIDQTEVNQNLTVRAVLFPTAPFQLNFADDFTDSNDFRDIRDPGSRRTGTGDFIRNTATAEAAYVLPRLRTGLRYTNILNNETIRSTDDTRIAHIVRPNAAYTDPRFSVASSVGFTWGNENSSVFIPYTRYDVDGRFQYVVTPTVSAGLAGYYQYQDPDIGQSFYLGRARVTSTVGFGPDAALNAEAGADIFSQQSDTKVRPSFLASYTHRFAAFALTARYEQGYRNRSEDVDASGVTFTRNAGVVLSTAFFRNTTGTFGVRYEENKFEIATISAGAPAGTTDRTWSIDLGIRYMIVRSLFLRLGYSGVFRTSTQDSAEFYENIVRLGLTYEYALF